MTAVESINFLAIWVLIMFPLVILASWLLSMRKVEAFFVGIFSTMAGWLERFAQIWVESWRETKQRWGK